MQANITISEQKCNLDWLDMKGFHYTSDFVAYLLSLSTRKNFNATYPDKYLLTSINHVIRRCINR